MAPNTDYVLGGDALVYLECCGFPQRLRSRIASILANKTHTWDDKSLWERQLYIHQPMLSDDAAQFKLLGFARALCWLHAERHVARLIPLNPQEFRAYEKTRDAIWRYYQRLKAYRQDPTPRKRQCLEQRFDRIFLSRTGWPELNDALRTIHSKKRELLLVLDHLDVPLHNNLSESDIRQFAKMRKISGSTRSHNGRNGHARIVDPLLGVLSIGRREPVARQDPAEMC